LIQQRLDIRGVIDILVGQIIRDYFAAIDVDADMQFTLGATFCCTGRFKPQFACAA
jgi:hypothetical protein